MREKFNVMALSIVVLVIMVTCTVLPIQTYEVEASMMSTPIPTTAHEEVTPVIEEPADYSEDIKLIALVVMAEAENQPVEGKILVIDTILNRRDDGRFPDTIHDVIYQKSQFTSMWNGRADRCVATDENCALVVEELIFRKNFDVIFFNTGNYSKYGTPMFKVGDHYFSSY